MSRESYSLDERTDFMAPIWALEDARGCVCSSAQRHDDEDGKSLHSRDTRVRNDLGKTTEFPSITTSASFFKDIYMPRKIGLNSTEDSESVILTIRSCRSRPERLEILLV